MSDYHSTHTGNIIDAAISAVIAGQAGIQGVKVNGVELTPDLANKVDVSVPEAGIQGVKVNGVELEKDAANKVDVPVPNLLTSTGQSTTSGMTQKAITDAIGSVSGIAGVKVNGVELTPDQSNKVDVPVPSLLTSTGQSTTAGMTQKAVTDELNKKSELHTYYVVPDKDNWVGQSAPYTQVFDMSSYTLKGDVFFADLGSEITVDSLEDWSCISSIDITNNIVTLTCLEDKPKNDLVVYLRGFTN